MGWPALMQAIYGLHVHVSVPDEEHAIRAVAALSRNVPLFVALSANSPFWAGSDTRLASVRAKVFGLMPRTGLPPAFRAWEEFEGYVEALVAAGIIPDYSLCWWDARPHPRLGTVELRAPDARRNPGASPPWPPSLSASWPPPTSILRENPLFTEENKGPRGAPPATGSTRASTTSPAAARSRRERPYGPSSPNYAPSPRTSAAKPSSRSPSR